jgi:hypothetical protein
MSYKKDVEQVAHVRDLLDRTPGACMQPMHALIGADLIACTELVCGVGYCAPLALSKGLRRTARHNSIREAAGMPVQEPKW